MKRWEKKVSIGLTSKQVTAIILNHIRHERQDLLGAFERLLRVDASEAHWFSWNGPQFHILSRPQDQAWTELQDLPEDPVYEDLSDGEDDDEGANTEPESSITQKRPAENSGTFSLSSGLEFNLNIADSDSDVNASGRRRQVKRNHDA